MRSAADRFEAAMQSLMARQEDAARLRASAAEANEILAEAIRHGDAVRRGRRGGLGGGEMGSRDADFDRVSDRLEELAGHLDDALSRALGDPQVAALRGAIERRDQDEAAQLAQVIHVDLRPPSQLPEHVYAPFQVRRRTREHGAMLMAPAAAGRALAAISRSGLHAAETAAPALPEPITLTESLDATGADFCVRALTAGLKVPLLLHETSGGLWAFVSEIPAPLTPCAAATSDDEWWAAAPLSYASYVSELRDALHEQRIELVIEKVDQG